MANWRLALGLALLVLVVLGVVDEARVGAAGGGAACADPSWLVQLSDRRALLAAALGFLQLPPRARELRLLHTWLDSWTGVGHIVTGMERHGFDLTLSKIHGDGWRASFYGNPMTSADGFAVAVTPWTSVQRAAWIATKAPQ